MTTTEQLRRWLGRQQIGLQHVFYIRHLLMKRPIKKTLLSRVLFPVTALPAAHALRKLGRELALARRKRGISTQDMAARLFVSRDTLWRLERSDPTVASGTLATATFILQLHERLANLVAPGNDALGLSLDEDRLPRRIRRKQP